VSEAEAAEMAREMEEDRRVAHSGMGAPLGGNPHKQTGAIQWWRDVASVRYEPLGGVSREHGEARIMRALIVEHSIRMDLKRSTSPLSTHLVNKSPPIIPRTEDARGTVPSRVSRGSVAVASQPEDATRWQRPNGRAPEPRLPR
jgi:hypothetical protein